jgi:urate oxidase
MAIVLGPNQYGKSEIRLTCINRTTPTHSIDDITVSSALRGDFTAAHLVGDNGHVLPTDTQKNTVYALARAEGIGEIEEFGLRLGRHFTSTYEWITGARIEIERHGWDRLTVGGRPHPHAFARSGTERRTTVVTIDAGTPHVVSGLAGLALLKTTGSEFSGFPRDRFTTLAETGDRVLATEVTARWRYIGVDIGVDIDFGAVFPSVRSILLDTFASLHSLALQQTLYAMGEAVLEAHSEIAEIRMSMPNKHHFLVDLTPFGMDNPNTVFHAADRPYGRIEGTVLRDDAPAAGPAWYTVPAFC